MDQIYWFFLVYANNTEGKLVSVQDVSDMWVQAARFMEFSMTVTIHQKILWLLCSDWAFSRLVTAFHTAQERHPVVSFNSDSDKHTQTQRHKTTYWSS